MSMMDQPEPPKRFSQYEPRKRSWPRILSAFAAGVACTILIVTFSRESPPLGQMAKSVQEAPRAEPAKTSDAKVPPAAEAATPPAQNAAAAPQPSDAARATTGVAGAPAGNAPTQAATPNNPERAVRVIPTDRNSSGARTTTEKKPAPAIPLRTTDGLGSGRDLAGAPDEQARIGASGTSTSQQTSTSGPQPSNSESKPAVATRSEQPASGVREQTSKSATEKPAPSQDATGSTEPATQSRSASREPSARELRQLRRAAKERERQARRSAERADRRRAARTEESDFEATTPAFEDEARSGREEIRRSSRETTRNGRSRASRSEEDEEVVIRTQRSRDGRELTVYREPRRERVETRRIIHEEPARPRLPFFFDLFNGGGRED